jgi:hypothetical protein
MVGVATVAFTADVSAAPILLTSDGGGYQVNSFEPIGQTFTAEDPQVHAGLSFAVINSQFPNDDAVEYSLFEGNGVGGALVASTSFNLVDGFAGFHLADFSSVALTVGNPYTLVASIQGDSPYWAVNSSNTPYAGGNGVTGGQPTGQKFALNVVPVAVPEPLSLALLGVGGVAVLARRRLASPRK